MRVSDDVKLAGDIYFADTVKKYPVILIRSPYPRKQYTSIAQYFQSKGYIVVVQSVRGIGGSGGQFIPFAYETEDGLNTLDYISGKSWCNGSIGIFGASYNSFCGLTLGASGHPALKALVNIGGWVDPSIMSVPAGVNHIMLTLPWTLFSFSGGKLTPRTYNSDSLFRRVPLSKAMQSLGVDVDISQIQNSIESTNSDFRYDKFDVPVLHYAGLYDFAKEGTFNLYDSLRKYNKLQRIIIGPWVHDQVLNPSAKAGDLTLPDAAVDSLRERVLRSSVWWFETFLKDKKENVEKIWELRGMPLFGKSFNLNASKFPDSKIKTTSLFLSSEQSANSLKGDGKLLKKNGPVEKHDTFTSDPQHPVQTFGGANFHFFPDIIGARDQTEIEKRNDVLVFTGPASRTQNWIYGPIETTLYVSCSTRDCDFTSKLVAVDPEDKAWIVTEGITRLSKAEKNDTGKKDINGNSIYKIQVAMGHTLFLLNPNWKLRLEVAGSNFPKYDRNPGTGEDSIHATKLIKTSQSIFHGAQFPSTLLLTEID